MPFWFNSSFLVEMSVPHRPATCIHGNTVGCRECCEREISELRSAFISDPDNHFILSRADYGSFTNALDNIYRQLKTSSTFPRSQTPPSARRVPQEEFQYNSSSPSRPVRFVGSAFGADPAATSLQYVPQPASPRRSPNHVPVRDRLMSPEKVGVTLHNKKRMYFSTEESNLLVEGYHIHGSRWEKIREKYPPLRRFTGVQLKDHYRHIKGRK